MKTSKKLVIFLPIFALILALGVLSASPSRLGSVTAQTAYQTPTPNEIGQILYEVQEGDTCTRVFLLTNVSIADIISLNGLDEACTIQPGQKLLLGQLEGQILTQTAMPTATIPPELITPTATPSAGFAKVCVVLFNDLDGSGMRTEGETYLYGGVVSINDWVGNVSLTGNTVAGDPETVDPICFENIPEGSYNVTMAIPDGFNATTATNYALEVKAGELATIDFGAQESMAIAEVPQADTVSRSPVLLVVGLVILLGGLGLGYYLWRQRKV